MALTIIHATIVNRTSLSGAIDCSAAPVLQSVDRIFSIALVTP